MYIFYMKLVDSKHQKADVTIERKFSFAESALVELKTMFLLAEAYIRKGYIITEVKYHSTPPHRRPMP